MKELKKHNVIYIYLFSNMINLFLYYIFMGINTNIFILIILLIFLFIKLLEVNLILKIFNDFYYNQIK